MFSNCFCFVLFVCLVVGGGGGGGGLIWAEEAVFKTFKTSLMDLSSQYSCTLASPSIDVPRVVGIICNNFVWILTAAALTKL